MAGRTLEELLREGEALRSQQRNAEAATVFEEVARQARAAADDDRLADALGWLALVRNLEPASDEELADVLVLQQEALAIDAKNHGDRHSRVANHLRLMAVTLDRLGRPSDAIDCLNRAAIIFRAAGTSPLRFEDTLAALAMLLYAQGDYTRAIDVGRELVSVCEQLQPGDPMRLTMAHVVLGQALVEAGDADAAIAQFERVLELSAPRIAQGGAQRLVAEMNDWLARARALSGADK